MPASGPELYRFSSAGGRVAMTPPKEEATHIATGETGFADVTYDLIAVQYHALKARLGRWRTDPTWRVWPNRLRAHGPRKTPIRR